MINHLDGHKVLVSAEGVLQNGHEIIIENEGMPIRGEMSLYGNLIITVNINFPKQYNKKQLEQIGKIFETGDAKFSDEDL
jgi:DnaJ-class molecular chaperone